MFLNIKKLHFLPLKKSRLTERVKITVPNWIYCIGHVYLAYLLLYLLASKYQYYPLFRIVISELWVGINILNRSSTEAQKSIPKYTYTADISFCYVNPQILEKRKIYIAFLHFKKSRLFASLCSSSEAPVSKYCSYNRTEG